jgi:hypothetical protein
MAAVISLQAAERPWKAGTVAATPASLPSAEAVSALALSYDAVAADVYWVRALQHFGRTRLSNDAAKRYDLLYPLLDLTTSLDPRFTAAYLFGAVFLAEPPPGGPGRADLAIALLEKGLKADPGKWEYAQAIGFVHYWWLQDFEAAAGWFARAAAIPRAPAWLVPLAANTLAQGGRRESSRLLWRQVETSAGNEWFQREARRRLQQLDAMDEIDSLQRLVDRVRSRGVSPSAWSDVDGRYRDAPPLDPAGVPYRLIDAIVTLDAQSPLAPLPSAPVVLR